MLFLRCAVIQWSEQTFAHFLSFVPFLDSKEIFPPHTPPHHQFLIPTHTVTFLSCLVSSRFYHIHTLFLSSHHHPPLLYLHQFLDFLRAPLYCCPPLRDLHPHSCPCLQKALCKSCNCNANPTVIYFQRLLTAYKSLPSAWILSVATSW